MFLRNRRFLPALVIFFGFLITQAQTLYWVGGSGNFNDPDHWSLSSGGPSSRLIPGPSNAIVFDNNFDNNLLNVSVASAISIKSLKISTYKSVNFISSSNNAQIKISERFEDILDNIAFQSNVPFEFSNSGLTQGYISTGQTPLNCNFEVKAGTWHFNKAILSYTNSLEVRNSNVSFMYSPIKAGALTIENCPSFVLNWAIFTVPGAVSVKNCSNYSATKSYLNKKAFSASFSNISISPNQGKYNNNNQINVPCIPTPTVVRPTCSPGCDGMIILTLPPFACFAPATPTAYILDVSPGPSCGTVGGLTLVPPGTYTLTNVCSCLSAYNLLLYDESGFTLLEAENASVTQPNISNTASGPATSTIACNASCTGTINMVFFGGIAPYNFTITPPVGPQSFSTTIGSLFQSSLCAGTLSVVTRDAANCFATFTRSFSQPSALNSNSIAANVICNSACDGGFTIAPTGGTANYTVNFSTGPTFTAAPGTTLTQTGLCPGPITATITDRNNCRTIQGVTITQPSTIIITPFQNNISCGGSCSGGGTVSVTGGGGAYTYSWNPATGSNSVNTTLCATSAVGIHTVTITDIPHGCVKTQTFNITEIPPIVISPTITNVVCNGSSTGSASITISGGTPTFQITWVRASPLATLSTVTGTSSSINAQPAGTYSVFVRDANACTTVQVIGITQPPSSLSIAASIQSVTCPGLSNGSATITASGGNGGPFSFTWTPAVAGNTNIATGLNFGNYTVTARDASNCATPASTFAIGQPNVINPNRITSTVSCFGACSGSISSTPTGGTGPYTFTLSTSTTTLTSLTGSFTNLCGSNGAGGVGVYTLFVGDANFPTNCAQSSTFTIAQPTAALSASASATPATCFSVCNGILTGTASGGTAPYTFNWASTSTITNNQSTLTGQCASASPYTLTAVDSRNCTFSTTVLLTQPSQVTLAVNPFTVSCSAGTNGTLSANGILTPTVNGGNAPYTFTWTGPAAFTANTQTIGNLIPGTYTLNYRANGCVQPSVTVVVSSPPPIVLSRTVTTTSCANLCNGNATLLATGGTPSYTYQFVTTVSVTNTSGIFPNVCGNFTSNAIDANGCRLSTSSVVPSPATITPAFVTTSVNCNGACTGVITVTPTGSTGPYTYTLTGPASTNIVTSAAAVSATFTNRCAGDYTLAIGDASFPATCSQTFPVSVLQPTAALSATASAVAATCFTVCNGVLSGTASGGTAPYVYNWTSSLITTPNSQTLGAQCAGLYTLSVVDTRTCTTTRTVQITQPTAVTITVNSATVSCAAGTNGTLSANGILSPTVTGGSGPYTFTWTGPAAFTANTQTIGNLLPGTYSLIVSGNGCVQPLITTTVFAPSAIALSRTVTSISCSNLCDATATLLATGGTPSYTYQFVSTGTVTNTSGIFPNVCGNFTSTAIDANGCRLSTTSVVPTPATITPAFVTTSVNCNGACTGVIAVTPTGSTGPYTYTLTGPASTNISTSGAAASATFSSRCAGDYTLAIGDAAFPATCSQTFPVSILQPTAALSATASATAATCFTVCNGVLSGTASGGTAPYVYNWTSSITTTPNSQTLGAQCAGQYTLTVVDNRTCTITRTVQITQPTAVTITVNSATVSCAAGTNGTLSANGILSPTVTGGSGPYTFTWTGPAAFTANTQTVGNLIPGTYSLVVSANGCIQPVRTATVFNRSAIVLSQTVTSISCASLCNATATLLATGGTPSFTYQFVTTGSLTNTSGLFSNVCGNYTAIAIDANGCRQSTISTVATPPVIQPNISSTTITCNGLCNGSFTTVPTLGSAPYSYTLVGPASTNSLTAPSGTQAVFSNLCAGNYTFFIGNSTFPATCSQSFTAIIFEPASAVSSTANPTAASCFTVCDGSLSAVNAIGGTGPYTYVWTSTLAPISVTAQTTNGRCAGQYTLNVFDNNGCTFTTTSIINEPLDITLASSTVSSVTCNGGNNGSVAITPTGGPSTSYSFSWSPGGQTTSSITGLSVNIYSVIVTSGVCSKNFTFDVVQPLPIVFTATTTEVNCLGSSDGSATLALTSGGTAPFTYSITGAPLPSNTTGTFTGLPTGTFAAFVIDVNSCTTSSVISVGTPTSAVSILALNTQSSCAVCSGSAFVIPTGGTAPYSFVWINSLGAIPSATNATVGALCPSPQYSVTISDSRSCTATGGFTISEVIIFVAASSNSVSCFGLSDGTATVQTISGGTPTYNVTWTPSSQTGLTANSMSANVVYTIQATDSATPACVGTQTLLLGEPGDIVITNSVITDLTCFSSNNGAITTTISGGPGTYSFNWAGPGSFTSTNQNITGLSFGDYTLTVSSGTSSCSKTFTFAVTTPSIINVTFNNNDPVNCTTVNSGTIRVNPTGGDGINYTYTWAGNPATTGTLNNVGPGDYTVNVTSDGCTQSFTTNLNPPLAPSITVVSSQSVNCFGALTGAASFSSTAALPISYTWSPAVSFTTTGAVTTATGIPSATYVVNMLDNNLCANSTTLFIPEATSITIVSTQTDVACNSASTGVISASVSGGTPGTPSYTFNWSTGTNATGTVSSITSLTALTTGATYSVLVTDGLGCTASQSYTLTEPVPFTFTTNSGNINCFGAANGSIEVIATPTTGVLYNWLPVPSATFAGSTNSLVSGLSPGIYTVNVTNGTCTAVGINTIQITEPALLAGTVAVNQNVTCFGGNDASASHTVTGGTSPYTYSWTGNTSTTSSASSLTAGSYTVFITDALGCATQNTFDITSPPIFDATLTASNPLCFASANGSIATQIIGNQGAVNFSWAPSGTGQSPTGLSVSGTVIFTLTATDASLCAITKTVQLVEPLALLANLSFTNPVCFGNCDGAGVSAPLNAAGSTTITWLPSNTVSTSISGLCSHPFNGNPNVYTVNVVDDNGCVASETFSLSVPTDIINTSTASPALCGVSNGSIVVTTTGGVGPYTYSWAPVAGSSTVLTNLNFGIYTLTVLDANGCSDIITVPVTASDGPTATVNSSSIQCNSACSGSISLSAISPTNTTIQWLPPLQASVTTAVLNNVCAGNYSVELTNPANNCKSYYGVAITEPPPVTVNSTSTEPTCFGICDGSISIAIAGGVPGYTFNWAGPDAFSSSNSTITSLCGGDYTLTIVDANSCTNTPIFSIPVLNNIVIQQPVAVTDNVCFGDCTGSATINVVSTTTNVLTATVNWSNGQFGPTGTALCNGVYSVIVTDTRGCSNTFSIPINSAPEINVNANITQPDCNQCNGVAEVVASGGNGPVYSYNWTNGATVPEISNLCAGLYQVLVSDNQNCKKLQNILINSSSGITADSVEVQDELCAIPCSGAATVIAIGGTTPIAYNWINPNLSNNSSSAGNLCPGTYFVQMTDADNCIRTSSLVVNAASSLSISTFIHPPTCALAPADGSVYVVVAGNTGTLNYTWNPGAITTPTLGNVAPGTYTLIVEDALTGCSKTEIISVSNLTGPTLTAVQKNIDCNTAEGSVSVTASSAVSYSWSTNATSSVVTNLLTGPVTVTVTDNNGCFSTKSYTINATPELEVQLVTQAIRCNNDCDGSIILLPFSGTLPYTFSMAIPSGSTSSTSNSTDSLCAGSYTAVVIDALGCRDTTLVNIINPTAITNTINALNASCSTLADGSASVVSVGGTGPYTYTWTGARGFASNSFTIENLFPGTYSVQTTDTLGCKSEVFTADVIPTVTIIANAGLDTLVCPGAEVILTGTNSIGAVAYSWFLIPSNVSVSSLESNAVFAIENERYELLTLSSLPGCVDRDTVEVNVYATPLLDAGPASYTVSVYSNTIIGGSPTSISGGPTHTWAPAEFIDNPFAQNPTTTNTVDVTFTVSMIYGNECFISDTVLVIILPEIVINNGFSPNGDGKNDFWYIDYIDQFPDNTVEVYNRWGEQLFYSKGYLQPFDGKFKGQDLPVGTYYYVIKLNDPRFTKPYTGPLTIFR